MRTLTMNNQEQTTSELEIRPEQYVELSALLDASNSLREEHAQDVVECFQTAEII